MTTTQTGRSGEDLAIRYLKGLGYEILERNYRIRGGEIDIIGRDGEFLVFVEVKTRHSHDYGLPVEAISPFKIKHLLRCAEFYLMDINYGNGPYRLDAVLIDFVPDQDKPKFELIKNITEF